MIKNTLSLKYPLFVFALLLLMSCNKHYFSKSWTQEKAPETFTAKFITSKGSFEVEVNRKASPLGVDRFYQLLKHHYLNNAFFYRVVPNFVVQFGNSDTLINNNWNAIKVPDEPVIEGNKRGTISFARDGKDTRSFDLFINLKDNFRLDTTNQNNVHGFPTFGKVIKGMNVVDALYGGYSGKTMDALDTMYSNRTKFKSMFPKLDKINKAYIKT